MEENIYECEVISKHHVRADSRQEAREIIEGFLHVRNIRYDSIRIKEVEEPE